MHSSMSFVILKRPVYLSRKVLCKIGETVVIVFFNKIVFFFRNYLQSNIATTGEMAQRNKMHTKWICDNIINNYMVVIALLL